MLLGAIRFAAGFLLGGWMAFTILSKLSASQYYSSHIFKATESLWAIINQLRTAFDRFILNTVSQKKSDHPSNRNCTVRHHKKSEVSNVKQKNEEEF